MNKMRLPVWQVGMTQIEQIRRKPDIVNADFFIKIYNHLNISSENRLK